MKRKEDSEHIVIIGSGPSSEEGRKLGLCEFLQDKVVLALNANYKDTPHTAVVSNFDDEFYWNECEQLKTEPLVLGMRHKSLPADYGNNVLAYNTQEYYDPYLHEGVYSWRLTGLAAMSIAAWLLGFRGVIWLIGFDHGSQGKTDDGKARTHRFQESNLVDYNYQFGTEIRYDTQVFAPYLQFEHLKIYNVSPHSRILYFPRVDWRFFFEGVRGIGPAANQETVRECMRRKLTTCGAFKT